MENWRAESFVRFSSKSRTAKTSPNNSPTGNTRQAVKHLEEGALDRAASREELEFEETPIVPISPPGWA